MMKKTIDTPAAAIVPLPQLLISVLDADGRNNALAVGFSGNVIHDMDKFEELGLRWEDGDVVDAPVLLDCLVNYGVHRGGDAAARGRRAPRPSSSPVRP